LDATGKEKQIEEAMKKRCSAPVKSPFSPEDTLLHKEGQRSVDRNLGLPGSSFLALCNVLQCFSSKQHEDCFLNQQWQNFCSR
jgi:hypothetical protein